MVTLRSMLFPSRAALVMVAALCVPALGAPLAAMAQSTVSSSESVEAALGLTRAQRVSVQRHLTELGFDVGAADGIFGPRTRAGIGKWQSSRGETATGYLDASAVDTLFEASDARPPEPRRQMTRAAVELLSEALSFARRVENAYSRAQALSAIANAQASAGDTHGATQTIAETVSTIEGIERALAQARALGAVAEAQASAGDIAGALARARGIGDAPSQAEALGGIARAQASAGDTRDATRTISEALSVTRRSRRALSHVRALGSIVEAQASAGDTGGAAQTISEALSIARGIERAFARAAALSHIAKAQATAGDVNGALTTARSIERDRALHRAWAFSAIAEAQVNAGDTRGAAHTVSEGLSSARTIDDARSRATALSHIAGPQASAGDIEGAVDIARSIGDASARARALSGIAKAQASAGDTKVAVNTARSIEDAFHRSAALIGIAEAQMQGTIARANTSTDTTRRADESNSERPVDSNGPATRQEFWGAYVPGQTTPSTKRVIYPYDVFGISWNFRSPETALDAAAKRCRERSAHNCGDGQSVTFSSAADDSGYHLKSRCLTAWVWADPGLSGLNQTSWTSGVELPEPFRTIQVAEKKTACNER